MQPLLLIHLSSGKSFGFGSLSHGVFRETVFDSELRLIKARLRVNDEHEVAASGYSVSFRLSVQLSQLSCHRGHCDVQHAAEVSVISLILWVVAPLGARFDKDRISMHQHINRIFLYGSVDVCMIHSCRRAGRHLAKDIQDYIYVYITTMT